MLAKWPEAGRNPEIACGAFSMTSVVVPVPAQFTVSTVAVTA
ncbi:MAG: hypothetical protein BWZ02_03292 [Lentisphaerae bacterium ADurb.BinA184]|nr:MAG: hypothetical protein BWZ02_03292 [Lentisphaerae bacterium ADurb.BinA184]